MLDLISPNWKVPESIRAFSTTRTGGNSFPPYDSLNLGDHVGDSLEKVTSNRKLLPLPSQSCWLNQVHGIEVIEFRYSEQTPVADGCFSKQQNQVCVVMTADCLPLLLTDKRGSFVAALHCGWRGLASGIIENFLLSLKPHHEIIAWLGPAIGPNAFEVGEDVFNAFSTCPQAFQEIGKGKFLASLELVTSSILRKLGVSHIYCSNLCTYSAPETFFSYRRDGVTGRMATCIWIEQI